MAKANRVHSTPPTNTSATNSPGPVDPTRRRLLTVAAGGAVAAAIPTAALTAAPAPDPIYAAIERHKRAAIEYDAAADIRGRFHDMDMNPEQERQCSLLDEARDAAWEPCEQAAIDLINMAPTTLTGIEAAIRYIIIQMSDDGTFMPHHIEYDNGGDAQDTMGWIDAFLDTLADATAALAKRSAANA